MSKVKKDLKNLAQCRCMDCPSFTVDCRVNALKNDAKKIDEGLDKANHFEGMFCAFEESGCIHEENGCLCGDCPVEHEYGLHHGYYCTHDVNKYPKEDE